METEKANTEVEVSPPSLADPVVAPEIEGVKAEGVNAEGEGEVSVKAMEEVPVPFPPPLDSLLRSSPQPASHPDNEAMATVVTEEITITDQDVLFGRGGLTNRHIGNLRYRDIISIHRLDYVRAQKTEKPNVARRIVKAIRTGKNPGRFLRKGDHGKWIAVSDKEAAWKASQALREKSRWSSMKQDDKQQASPPAVEVTVDSTVQKVVETASTQVVEKPKKRKASEAEEEPKGSYAVADPEMKKVKAEAPVEPPQPQLPLEAVPTEISHITVPPVVTLGNTKQVGANYMLPAATLNTNASDIFPKDEDVLFGRGGRTNHHPGNKRLRQIVNKYRDTYYAAKKVDKPKVSKLVVSALRSANPPSRFLRMNEETTQWEDVGDKRAAEKVSQTLREKDRDAKAEYVAQKSATQDVEPVGGAVFVAAAKGAPEERKMSHLEDIQVQVEDMQVQVPSPEKVNVEI
mmetsp:Transcript_10082/g.18142  ORF Transcript_10082/g.18142 Transcript_10082/m.18142 type:complete len:460 (-) Transcript_10082:125-1504(-)